MRNRGTIGGNLCSNDPTNHLPPLMVALGATMTIRDATASAARAAEEFFLGVYMTAVGPGELLTSGSSPPRPEQGDGFASLTIGKDGTGIVNVAATVIGRRGAHRARMRGRRAGARRVDRGAPDRRLSEQAVRAAAEGLGATLDPPSDVHAPSDYRRHLAEVVAVRAVVEAAERARS